MQYTLTDPKIVEQKIANAIATVEAAVGSTLGPSGKTVLISRRYGVPLITKDGVTVAKEIILPDPAENAVAQVYKEAASKTAEEVGDGTTTSTVLAKAIFDYGKKIINNKNTYNNNDDMRNFQKGLNIGAEAVFNYLRKHAIPVDSKEMIYNVALIALNTDQELATVITDAIDKIGSNGVIFVTEGSDITTSLEITEGLRFDKGYVVPHFINVTQTATTEFTNPYIIVIEDKVMSLKPYENILTKIAQEGRPVVFIADDYEKEAIQTMIINKVKGALQSVAVRAPGFGEHKKEFIWDIAAATGAKVVGGESPAIAPTLLTLKDLGSANTVRISKNDTTIIGGKANQEVAHERLKIAKASLRLAVSEFERERLEKRIAILGGVVGLINVGAATEGELKEKKARVEDAIFAVRAAIESGIIPGGGCALAHASQNVIKKLIKSKKELKRFMTARDIYFVSPEEIRAGLECLAEALTVPLQKIAENANYSPKRILDSVLSHKEIYYGFNAITERFGNMYEMGIIDPVKVTISALRNAISVAFLLLNTRTIIYEVEENNPDKYFSVSPHL